MSGRTRLSRRFSFLALRREDASVRISGPSPSEKDDLCMNALGAVIEVDPPTPSRSSGYDSKHDYPIDTQLLTTSPSLIPRPDSSLYPSSSRVSVDSTQPLLPHPHASVTSLNLYDLGTGSSDGPQDPPGLGDTAPSDAADSPTSDAGSLDHDVIKTWSDCARLLMEYDETKVRRWKEEIDTLLVFAGLFSAVVTAFLVESCKALHPEPTERVVEVLELIVAELRNTTNEHSPARLEADTRFVPAHIAPLVNALWSTSLTISLSVAFIGLLVKQWLGEYTAGLMNVSRSRVSKKHAHARQHRHDALRKWRVQMIIAALPVLLQIALFFFLVGLTQLFMAFNRDVGIVALSFLILLAAFSFVTTLLPTLVKDCPYRSPQALVPYVLKQLGYSVYCGILSLMAPKRRAKVRFEEIKYSYPDDISTASSSDSTTIQKRQSLRSQSQPRTNASAPGSN
ncbi:hypothetical protein C8Q74DRAFT_100877 [Fomes fomentarius]|nr:hypothetical protein C8Q74DRAFT_100877 [Fomes fomentarius]